jgi:hypothetical protein
MSSMLLARHLPHMDWETTSKGEGVHSCVDRTHTMIYSLCQVGCVRTQWIPSNRLIGMTIFQQSNVTKIYTIICLSIMPML